MIVIHAKDPTTQFLSQLYSGREDVSMRIDERATTSEVMRAIRSDDTIMMLGHGNEWGVFSKPDKKGRYTRHLVGYRNVDFLRGKTCIGIWCHANKFAERYGLQGLFTGMIISELQEANDNDVPTTQEELTRENEKFARRLRYCLDHYPLNEIPERMRAMDDVHSPLTEFNYARIYFAAEGNCS